MAAGSPSAAYRLGGGIHNKALPLLADILNTSTIVKGTKKVAGAVGNAFSSIGEGQLASSEAYSGAGKAGIDFTSGLVSGIPAEPTSTGGGYSPGLYTGAPELTSSIYDAPASVPEPVGNPFPDQSVFVPGSGPAAAFAGHRGVMQPYVPAYDPSGYPMPPTREPIDQNIDQYFTKEETALEAAKPHEPKFDNLTLIMRGLAGAALGAAAGGDVMSAFAGGLTGVASGLEKRTTQEEKFTKDLESYNLRKAGFESKKGYYLAANAEKQKDITFEGKKDIFARELAIEERNQTIRDKNRDILYRNRVEQNRVDEANAEASFKNSQERQTQTTLSDGIVYEKKWNPAQNGQPAGTTVTAHPLDQQLYTIERQAKLAKGLRDIAGVEKEQSIATSREKIVLPPGPVSQTVATAVAVSTADNDEFHRSLMKEAEIEILREQNKLPVDFDKLSPAEQNAAVRDGRAMITTTTGSIVQFEDEKLKRVTAKKVERFRAHPEEAKATAERRMY